MKKSQHVSLMQVINEAPPKGHHVIKLHTQGHSAIITRVECNCGQYHHIRNNSNVDWGVNLLNRSHKKDDLDSSGISGVNYNNF